MESIDIKQNFDLGHIVLKNFIFLTEDEKEMVKDWRNDAKVKRWMYTDHIITAEEHRKFIENLKKDDKNFYWLVKKKDYGYLGVIYLNRANLRNKNAYLGIYSNPNNRVKGKGEILLRCLINIAFKCANLHTLKLEVLKDNDKARGLYSSSGFLEEGRLEEFVFKDGKWKDVIVMGIVNKCIENQ